MVKKIRIIIYLFLFNLFLLNQLSFANTLSADVETAFGKGETVKVIVRLKEQVDTSGVVPRLLQRAKRSIRSKAVVDALKNRADSTQVDLSNFLEGEKFRGNVRKFRRFWIFNGFALEATEEVIRKIAARNEVKSVDIDKVIQVAPPFEGTGEAAANGSEWNIARVQAPDVWGLGYTGQGVVVGSMDSGVDYTHPDLVNNYRGGSNSWLDAVSGNPTPYDNNGHGTHTMGIAVGSNVGGTDIGVAPGAQWIACKALNSGGSGFTSDLHTCFQWFLDPDGDSNTDDAPHVVNNSWGGSVPCNQEFRQDVIAWRSAGIFSVFSIGNNGPTGNSTEVPGGYPESTSVGATSSNNMVIS